MLLLSADQGDNWERIDLARQGMDRWELTSAASDSQRMVVGGHVGDGTATSRPAVAVSDDGRTWDALAFPDGASGQVRDVAITSDGTLVAVGWKLDPFGPVIWLSADGRTPVAVDLPDDEPGRIHGVAAGPDGLVVIGNEEREGHARIWGSCDGVGGGNHTDVVRTPPSA